MNSVVISIGSNCGDRPQAVGDALAWLSRMLADPRSSSLYETPEIHGAGAPYINAVICGATPDGYEALNACLKQYEVRAGRDDDCRRRGLVPLDLDIVIWNERVIRPADYAARFFTIGYEQIMRGS